MIDQGRRLAQISQRETRRDHLQQQYRQFRLLWLEFAVDLESLANQDPRLQSLLWPLYQTEYMLEDSIGYDPRRHVDWDQAEELAERLEDAAEKFTDNVSNREGGNRFVPGLRHDARTLEREAGEFLDLIDDRANYDALRTQQERFAFAFDRVRQQLYGAPVRDELIEDFQRIERRSVRLTGYLGIPSMLEAGPAVLVEPALRLRQATDRLRQVMWREFTWHDPWTVRYYIEPAELLARYADQFYRFANDGRSPVMLRAGFPILEQLTAEAQRRTAYLDRYYYGGVRRLTEECGRALEELRPLMNRI